MAVETQTIPTFKSNDKMRQYYIDHRQRILDCSTLYYKTNREHILKHRNLNKEKIALYFKNHKVHCEICDIDVLIGSKCNHYRSKKHLLNTYIKNDHNVPKN